MATKPASRTPMLTQADIADQMQVTVKTVARWIEKDELKVHRIGRLVRIAPEDFDLFRAVRRIR